MKKKNLIILGLALVLSLTSLTGCVSDGTADEEEDYTDTLKEEALSIVGLPDVSNFFEMSQLKEIYELRDNPDLVCYWYTKSDYSGKWVYQGTCVGYGIPYSTQMTSPDSYYMEGTTLPQAEPNALYSGGSTSATWILQIAEDGSIKPAYIEDDVTVVQIKIDANRCEDWSIPADY